jgi:hypothetical protein
MDEDSMDLDSRRRLMAEAAEARFAKLSRPSAHPPNAPPHTASVGNAPAPAVSSASTPTLVMPSSSDSCAPAEITASASGPLTDPVQEVQRLDAETATQLFTMVFGVEPPLPQVMGQWSRQGFRFQSAPPSAVLVQVRRPNQPESCWRGSPCLLQSRGRLRLRYSRCATSSLTSPSLVYHTQSQGGPCGVLAPLQALLLKHLLFDGAQPSQSSGSDVLAVPPAIAQTALLRALEEALWGCGGAPRGEALVASLLPTDLLDDSLPADGPSEVLIIDSASALHSLV